MTNRYKKIFSKSIAVQLIVLGNELLYTELNRLKHNLSVFVFNETEELLEQLTSITNKNKEKRMKNNE